MGNFWNEISESHQDWIRAQKLFFVATAPLSSKGHVNVSPKGHDTFRILGPNKMAYIELTGSGVETWAHLVENGRITIMFCAFDGKPRILRLWGWGRVCPIGTKEFEEHLGWFDGSDVVGSKGVRSI